jgi:uncharacterized protein YbaP (TraB family)
MRQTGLLIILLVAACTAHAEPAAWRAVRPHDEAELLLLGSIHVLRREDYPLPPIVDALYSEADSIVMELELDAIDPIRLQTGLMGAALLTDGHRLSTVLDPVLYARTEREAENLGIPLDALEPFEPWFVAITLSSLGIAKLGYHAEMGLEQYFVSKAATDGKDVLGLESLEEQIAIFDSLSARDQESLLVQTLDEITVSGEMMAQLSDRWRSGRLDELANQLLEDFAPFPGLYESLVANRNRAWAKRLAAMARGSSELLVVVGALHLVERNNLVELLEAEGFVVSPVR